MFLAARTQFRPPTSGKEAAFRVEAKRGVVEQVIEGRLPLLAGAARFKALCAASWPITDIEDLCRTVIGWAGLALSDRPERATVVVGRLEAELDRYLARPLAGRPCLA